MHYLEHPLQNLQPLSRCKTYSKKNISKTVNDIKEYIQDDFYANEGASRDFPIKTFRSGKYTINVQKFNSFYQYILRMKTFAILYIKHKNEIIGRLDVSYNYSEEQINVIEMRVADDAFTHLFLKTFDDDAYTQKFGLCN